MSLEFNSGQKVEKAEPTHTEQALRKIEEHFNRVELGSARFQAFADYVDLRIAGSELQDARDKSIAHMEYCLITETIRQRENGVLGYRKEYANAVQLVSKLGEAVDTDRKQGKNVSGINIHLENIKNSAIDRKGQQSLGKITR